MSGTHASESEGDIHVILTLLILKLLQIIPHVVRTAHVIMQSFYVHVTSSRADC